MSLLKIRRQKTSIIKVDQSDIYLGLFGNEYGKSGTDGFSPTEREFRQATKKGKHRLIYVMCRKATEKDIDTGRQKLFLRKAKNERNYSLNKKTPPGDALIHLNLSDKKRITNAAVLLFGNNPQGVFTQSETKCMHFHGTEVEKPIPSYQVFKGSLFAQVDNALDFVLSKLDRSIVQVSGKVSARREYKIPDLVVREAIVFNLPC